MSVTTYYTLTVGGTLGVPFDRSEGIRKEWTALFGDQPKPGAREKGAYGEADADWPRGFLLDDPENIRHTLTRASDTSYPIEGHWKVESWDASAEPVARGAHTKLTFKAEVEFEGNFGIHEHRKSQKAAAAWFFDYLEQPWHKELSKRLSQFAAKHDDKKQIEPIGFKEWEFYCGNGGGGGE
jgi:hypothetical protein